jgi:23S rRNA pseudouridine1911/1915/1917 synthase
MRNSNPCRPDKIDCDPDALGEPYSVHAGKESAGMRLDKFLAEALSELSRSRIKALINQAHVSCDGGVVSDPAAKVKVGNIYKVYVPPAIDPEPEAENIPLDVVFEDDDLIVINKAAGMVVHPAPGNYSGTLVNALLHHAKGTLSGIGGVKRPGIVHRIDKDTSGLLVAAKSDAAHQGLSALFSRHDITRVYTALVKGRPNPSAGHIEGNIARHPQNRKKMCVAEGRGKPAITHYQSEEVFSFAGDLVCALVRCKLETGRTHQVRVHMAHIGHPLLGDPLYARRITLPKNAGTDIKEFFGGFNRQALHAEHLGFKHPISGKNMKFEASLPEDMQKLVNLLRQG